jgi:hypothetical protein
MTGRNANKSVVAEYEGTRAHVRTRPTDIVTCVPIAKQRVVKHIPATHAHATIRRLLLGNESKRHMQ